MSEFKYDEAAIAVPGPSRPGTSVSVMLVDDHDIWRDGVKSLLVDTEFVVVGEAASGPQAVVVARQVRPQIMLLDIHMAGGDGLDSLQALKTENPRMAVLMLTSYEHADFMARAVAGGAAGYLLKELSVEDLLGALRAVASGEMPLPREVLLRSLQSIAPETAQSTDLINPLSLRELEVLRLLTTGMSNKEIAPLLFIGESTVKTHVAHVIAKLGVSDRVQAVVWAARHGLLSPA